ncbi:MAG: UDP-3-O-acyl-N-acetylglucosamine deacetylase [Alphaproteobacteria bacterium]|nr:UDP-3-O-acyl-N-acetylglucosamine deacetylase [Alphaproteobacteria bacterium]
MLDGMNMNLNSYTAQNTNKGMLRLNQTTLKNPIHCNGVGLHSGQEITLALKPAAPDHGIVFQRIDVAEAESFIKADFDSVVDTRLCTTIGNEFGVNVGTIEHLMAAIVGCGLDNVLVQLDGPEVPVMDGSSEPFVFLIECAGIEELNAERNILVVKKPVTVSQGDCVVSLKPADSFCVSLAIDFENKAIGRQDHFVEVSQDSFKNEICRARTFGSVQDVDKLRQMGLARGASLDNAVALDGDRVLNEEGLRYNDEFVRHKVLDCIGDLGLAGFEIHGHFEGYKAGHALNNAILHALFSDESNWEIMKAYEVSPAAPLLKVAGD